MIAVWPLIEPSAFTLTICSRASAGRWAATITSGCEMLLNRLTHTAVRTNIRGQGKKKSASFHWLEGWTEVVDEKTGEPNGMTITLPDWLYSGIVTKGGVLTIHEDYFLLTGGIERWLYRVARKHAGSQELGWQFTMRNFTKNLVQQHGFLISPSTSERPLKLMHCLNTPRRFTGHAEDEVITFIRRSTLAATDPRFEARRNPRRRVGFGIKSQPQRFTGTA